VSLQTADAIEASGVFDAREQQMIWRGNAAKLFPRLA
jgi:hypothetical protein